MADSTKRDPNERPPARARLIKAASQLFQRRGYAAVGLTEILTQADAPKGSLYHHFPGGKPELGAAAMRGAGQGMRETLKEAYEASGDSAGAVEGFAARLGDWLEHSEFRAGCPMATVALERAPEDGPITETIQTGFEMTRSDMADLIAADGVNRARADVLAELALASLEGALILARVEANRGPVERVAAAMAALIRAERG